MNKINVYAIDSNPISIPSFNKIILFLIGFMLLAASQALGVEYYVSATGSNSDNGTITDPFATIQHAIDQSDVTMVTVLPGTYTGDGNRDIDFMGKPITVRSAYGPEVTIIDCQASETDKHRGFYFHRGETAISVLDGFTIKNGYGPIEPWSSGNYSVGGGIYCTNASPMIINNIIINNAAAYGAGVNCWEYASATIKSNLIKNNHAGDSAGGVYYYKNSSGRLDSNVITGNQAYYSGGGVQIDMFSDVTVVNNSIANNSVTQPASSRGGGIYSGNSHSLIANNTISQNSSEGEAGGVYNWCGWPTIVNTIVWGNTGGEVAESTAGDCSGDSSRVISASYSNVNDPDSPTNPFPGAGNIYSDPLFIDPLNGDFHLHAGSPCIDAADNSEIPPGIVTDIDGEVRIAGAAADMGADEFVDTDADLVPDINDNCASIPNADQADLNGDGAGDVCGDMDGDTQKDAVDPWPFDPFNDQDVDGWPADPNRICESVCATCTALETLCLQMDNCPGDANADQTDEDSDGVGDVCDPDYSPPEPCGDPPLDPCEGPADPNDTDGDNIVNGEDLCPDLPIDEDPYGQVIDPIDNSVNHLNTDNDQFGDGCDDDDDNDGILDDGDGTDIIGDNPCTGGSTTNCDDNCRLIPNAGQTDMDCDGIGDACDEDIDGDGIWNDDELAGGPYGVTSPTNADSDDDGQSDGDAVPICPAGLVPGPDETPLGDPGEFTITFTLADASDNSIPIADYLPEMVWRDSQWGSGVVKLTATVNGGTISSLSDFSFQITNTTNHEGIATNSEELTPWSNDFSFDQNNPDLLSVSRTANPGTFGATATLYAHDFGGSVTVEVNVTVNGTPVQAQITLPQDSDFDDLPDAWEMDQPQQDAGFDPYNSHTFSASDLDGDADIDTSLNNIFDTDGLSNFKEYRGIVFDDPNGAYHLRLNPGRKDLFVRGDNFANSVNKTYTDLAGDVQAFSVNHNAVFGGPSAFEAAEIDVHDVTEMESFSHAEEPLNIDILVVTNKTERRAVDHLIVTIPTEGSLGVENGYINHPSQNLPHVWKWDLKGASYIGNSDTYAILTSSGATVATPTTHTYHLCMMNYVFNRPYYNDDSTEWSVATNPCYSPEYNEKLDPLGTVEDRHVENGVSDKYLGNNWEHSLCIDNAVLDGDRMDQNWITYTYISAPLYDSTEQYYVGTDYSVFDADGDGLVENPVADTAAEVQALTHTSQDPEEYTIEQVQQHTVLHEMGHAVGMDELHTSDPSCLMYDGSPNWSRAGTFSDAALLQIKIHNKTE